MTHGELALQGGTGSSTSYGSNMLDGNGTAQTTAAAAAAALLAEEELAAAALQQQKQQSSAKKTRQRKGKEVAAVRLHIAGLVLQGPQPALTAAAEDALIM